MSPVVEILITFLGSTFKFLFGLGSAVGFGFSYFKAVSVVVLGGFLGTVLSVYLIDKGLQWLNVYFKTKRKKKKRSFTRINKFIVLAKRRFGLVGIAAITPLLSYPLGCYLALRYFKNKRKVILYMFVSVTIWSVFGFLYKLVI